MARHQEQQQCSLTVETRQIRDLVAEAREGYRAAGPSYGDDDPDFCHWLLARPRLASSA